MEDPLEGTKPIEQRPGEPSVWFMRLIKFASVVLGCIGFVLGIFIVISTDYKCIIAGILQMVGSLIMVGLELPVLCSCMRFIEPLLRLSERTPHWFKVVIYLIPPISVLLLCVSLTAIFAALCLFGVAALYFFLTIRTISRC